MQFRSLHGTGPECLGQPQRVCAPQMRRVELHWLQEDSAVSAANAWFHARSEHLYMERVRSVVARGPPP
jgi:hypothetical protein